jgi:hypothetical protein
MLKCASPSLGKYLHHKSLCKLVMNLFVYYCTSTSVMVLRCGTALHSSVIHGAGDTDGLRLRDGFGIPANAKSSSPSLHLVPHAIRSQLWRFCKRLFIILATISIPIAVSQAPITLNRSVLPISSCSTVRRPGTAQLVIPLALQTLLLGRVAEQTRSRKTCVEGSVVKGPEERSEACDGSCYNGGAENHLCRNVCSHLLSLCTVLGGMEIV